MGQKSRLKILEAQVKELSAFRNESLLLQAEQVRLWSEKEAYYIATISDLQSQLKKQAVQKTSSNSHKPPSTDLARKNQSLREKSGNPVGGQIGHKGFTLEMTDSPDKIENLYPSYCNNCGESLSESVFSQVGRRQEKEIPLPQPIVTEYRCHSTTCKCGHHQMASYPDGIINHIQFGPNVQAVAVYNNIFQFLPFGRSQDYFAKVFNLNISKATIENMIRRAAQKAKSAYETLRQEIELSFFVGSDETGFKVNGSKHWFWVWQNSKLTYIVASDSRSKQVISDVFPQGLPNSIVGSDRLAAQLSTLSKGKQVCLAHLLRDVEYLIKAEAHPWATEFKAFLKQALELKKSLLHYTENDPNVLQLEQLADKLLSPTIEVQLLEDSIANKDTLTFFRGMVKVRQFLLTFLYDERIAGDNNGSERAIRVVKIKTKISGQFKSLQAAFAIVRSVVDTAIKNGMSPFDAIRAIIDLPTTEPVLSG